jgi:hypothetical protein
VFWDVTPCGSYNNRSFGGTYRFRHQLVLLRSVLQLLVNANSIPSWLILSNLMIEAIRSYETSVITRAVERNTPEEFILRSHLCEKLKSYIELTGWAL